MNMQSRDWINEVLTAAGEKSASAGSVTSNES